MNNSIFTSELDLNINREKINKDFTIFQVIINNGDKKNNLAQNERFLQSLSQSDSFVCNQSGLYILARKTKLKKEEIDKNLIDYENSRCFRIDLYSSHHSDRSIPDHKLLQLFVNTLSNPKTKYTEVYQTHYTDCLIYAMENHHKTFIDGAIISILFPATIKIKLKRYSKINQEKAEKLYKKEPIYIYDYGWTLYRKRQKQENTKNGIYCIEKNNTGKKANAPFIDFNTKRNFNYSKIGILKRFLDDIHNWLSDYFTLELKERSIVKFKNETQTFQLETPDFLKKKIGAHNIDITDQLKNNKSSKIIEQIITIAMKEYGITIQKKDNKLIDPNHFQINLIHNKKYYKKERHLNDQYMSTDNTHTVQNITLEDFGYGDKTRVRTIIKELILKNDLLQNKITLYDDYKQLNRYQNYQFVIVKKSTEEKEMDFFVLKFSKQGKFTLKKHTQYQIINDDLHNLYLIRNYIIEKKYDFSEMFIIDDHSNINVIENTGIITIPNIDKIHEKITHIEEKLPDFANTYGKMAKLINQMRKDSPFDFHHGEEVNQLIKIMIGKSNQLLEKKAFKQLLNEYLPKNCKENQTIRNILHEKYDILLHFSKAKEIKEELFSSNMDLYIIKTEEPQALYYYVGQKNQNLRSPIQFATPIRRIFPLKGSELFGDKLLFMMDVDFVRTSDRTVLPFPAKYIREFMKIPKNENDA